MNKFRDSYILQIYLIPFYVLVYMIFSSDPVDERLLSEIEFNKTVAMKTAREIIEIIGEPDSFEIRENDRIIVFDYYNLVFCKKKEDKYTFVRLILFERGEAPLLPENIFFKK